MRFEDKVANLRIKKHKGFETKEFLLDVKRLAEGEAFEYITGEVIFCDVIINLSLRPMIPRPETEFWVREAFNYIQVREMTKSFRALDLFSGSGCVGIACAKHFKDSEVDCIELDPKLKEQIKISALKNNVSERIQAITGDVFEGATGKYNVIFAVPPYVPSQMRNEVMQELHAEAELSFFDREDGFYFHTQVLTKSQEFLVPDGLLCLEFDITQKKHLETLIVGAGWKILRYLKDPYGHDAAVIISR